jgi:hypothetical protein
VKREHIEISFRSKVVIITQLTMVAGTLDAKITPADAKKWATGNAKSWAVECHRVSREHVYKGVPADGPPPKLDQNYSRENRPVVEGQLGRGRIRMATVLNQALGGAASTKPIR